MSKEPSFSLYEFRSWLAKQNDVQPRSLRPTTALLGQQVESRLGKVRLSMKMHEHNRGHLGMLVAEFAALGGTIVAVEQLLVTIQVPHGTFQLPKMYVKAK